MTVTIGIGQLPVASQRAAEDTLGRVCYEGFSAPMKPWLPLAITPWEDLPEVVRNAWIAAAKAARSV